MVPRCTNTKNRPAYVLHDAVNAVIADGCFASAKTRRTCRMSESHRRALKLEFVDSRELAKTLACKMHACDACVSAACGEGVSSKTW